MAEETATLAAYVADLKFADIPHEVLARAKVLTLDFLGSAIRARRDAESTPSLLKMLEALALDGQGQLRLPGPHQGGQAFQQSDHARHSGTLQTKPIISDIGHGCCPPPTGGLKPGISPPTLCGNSEETRWPMKPQRSPPMSPT